jgi:hypothetical protein
MPRPQLAAFAMTPRYIDDSIVKVKKLAGTGRWVGINDRYRFGPEQLSQDAQLVLGIALAYRSGRVPTGRGIYEAQRDQAKALGQRYMGERRVKAALAELKDRGFYGIRRISAGRDMIITIRSYSNKPFEHLAELESEPREAVVARYFPGRTVAGAEEIDEQETQDDRRTESEAPPVADCASGDDDGDRQGPRPGGRDVGQLGPVEPGVEDGGDLGEVPGVRRAPRRGARAQPARGRGVVPRERVGQPLRPHRLLRKRDPRGKGPDRAARNEFGQLDHSGVEDQAPATMKSPGAAARGEARDSGEDHGKVRPDPARASARER